MTAADWPQFGNNDCGPSAETPWEQGPVNHAASAKSGALKEGAEAVRDDRASSAPATSLAAIRGAGGMAFFTMPAQGRCAKPLSGRQTKRREWAGLSCSKKGAFSRLRGAFISPGGEPLISLKERFFKIRGVQALTSARLAPQSEASARPLRFSTHAALPPMHLFHPCGFFHPQGPFPAPRVLAHRGHVHPAGFGQVRARANAGVG